MDLLGEIRRRAQALEGRDASRGMRSVVQHIESAVRHLERGREQGEEEFFNDVIYRTNQAFEGALKEAYCVLATSKVDRPSPYDIEQHLIDTEVLPGRVSALLTNYRQQWRNPATHDHTLVFSEQEALLAIVSVSAFVSILIDQIVERIGYLEEQRSTRKRVRQVRESMPGYGRQSFQRQLLLLLERFASDNMVGGMREAELVGRIGGYLKTIDQEVDIDTDAVLSAKHSLRPDLLVRKAGRTIVVEVKSSKVTDSAIRIGQWQLLKYVTAGNLDRGLLFVAPQDPTVRLGTLTGRHVHDEGEAWIDVLAPESLIDRHRGPESV